MINSKIITLCMFILINSSLNCVQNAIPFNSDNWKIEDANANLKEMDLTTLYGKPCLHLPVGNVAYLKDNSYKNFTLEMDIAGIAMPGIGFRGIDKRNYEYVYLRVMSDNQQDATQYVPIFNGGFAWQLYNYPNYEKKVSYPKRYVGSISADKIDKIPAQQVKDYIKKCLQSGGISSSDAIMITQTDSTIWKVLDPKNLSLHYLMQRGDSVKIYSGLEWIHIKLQVFGRTALLFVEDMETPVMEINCLKQKESIGYITLRNFFVESYYSNISIEKIIIPTDYKKCEPNDAPEGYLSEWEMSEKFKRNDQTIKAQIDSVIHHTENWKSITSDSDGLINISKYFDVTEGTVLLKTSINSTVDEQVELLFDYSEHLVIALNSKIIFSESLRIKDNEGRVIDGEEKINLELEKGTNELIFVLTSDSYQQNWGMIAKLVGAPG